MPLAVKAKEGWAPIWGAIALALPWLVLRFSGYHGPPLVVTVLSGMAILGAAFVLSWAAEVIQLDVTQAFAIALLALIAVLPEYSVDMYLAWKAGTEPAYAHFAIANMTGANRLLIGVGWSAVVLITWWRFRQKVVNLGQNHTLEISVLALATLFALFIPLRGELSLWDTIVLMGLFGVYTFATTKQESEAPELLGPSQAIGMLPCGARRLVTAGLFLYAAVAILASAEPFAEGLLEMGRRLHVEQFLLVQWLAPLASEAPEFLVATLFALRGHPQLGLRTLISSKVNQWTLLVGTLPVVYSISAGAAGALALDARQTGEVLLTAAQSLFAVAIIARLTISYWQAFLLLALFSVQLAIPLPEARYVFSAIYLVLGVGFLVGDSRRRDMLFGSIKELGADLLGRKSKSRVA